MKHNKNTKINGANSVYLIGNGVYKNWSQFRILSIESVIKSLPEYSFDDLIKLSRALGINLNRN